MEQISSTNKDTDALWIALGLIHRQANEQRGTHVDWYSSVAGYDSFIAKADAYQRAGNMDEAIKWYELGVEARLGDQYAQQQLAILNYDLGRFDQAVPYLQASISANPADALNFARLCEVYRVFGDPLDSISVYQDAPSSAKEHPFVQICAGKAFNDLGDYESSAEHLERAVSLNYASSVAHFWLSLAKNRLGDIEAALKEAELAVALEPERAGYLKHLLNLYSSANNCEQAEKITEKLRELDPANESTSIDILEACRERQ